MSEELRSIPPQHGSFVFTSESVTEGHPDKICDQISDGILDALLAVDPNSRCACETTAEPGAVHIMGEITTAATVNYIEIARRIIREILDNAPIFRYFGYSSTENKLLLKKDLPPSSPIYSYIFPSSENVIPSV